MTIGAKHMDPIVGVDTHIVMIPSPAGPIPTPLPNPYVGMVMDPFDYAPIIGGTVYINGMMRGQAGTGGIALVPHMPLGGPLVPPPTNESEIFMGSATVASDGDAQSYLGLMVLSCQSVGMPPPPRAKGAPPKSLVLPTSAVLSVPMGPPVLIGGPPTISLMALGFRAGFAALGKLGGMIRKAQRGPGRFGDAMRAVTRKANNAGDALADALKLGAKGRQRIKNAVCTVTGHPVDVATGRVFTEKTDLELPGPIPFVWKRSWSSTSTYVGELGHGWHHSFQHALYVQKDVVLYRDDEGRAIPFPPLAEGQEFFSRPERLTLIRDARGYALRTIDRLVYRFRNFGRSNGQHVLASIQDPVGNALQFLYDERGVLAEIIDSCGRRLQLTHDRAGRITALIAPHPDVENQRFYVAQYSFDQGGNLVQVLDALNQPTRYHYVGHLLVQETDRNGLSFYFAYDGHDENAKCVRTWGDGGIYDHKIRYDVDTGVTWVENSLDHTTQHRHEGGQVVEVVDALGGVTLTEYNDHGQNVKQTDPVGAVTTWAYDERGNTTKIMRPDGATLTMSYGPMDKPIEGKDAMGGAWKWTYDEHGRVVERVNPLGATIRFVYQGARLTAIHDPVGSVTDLIYDGHGMLIGVRVPNGARSFWERDRLGRIVRAIDLKGNVQHRNLDLLGRVIRIDDPDGNVCELGYDREGNVVHAKDAHSDVRFTYQGMGRLATRSEAGTTIHFEYDTEEQLTGIVNEHGHVYRFELGSTGNIDVESGFDGSRRRYVRDLAGRVIKVFRPEDRSTEYAYDQAGRVLSLKHSDGITESYEYRADGELIQARTATPATTTVAASTIGVKLERDPVGRVVKETQFVGDHQNWVSSEYSPLGLRASLTSSKGLQQTIRRNAMGYVIAIEAGMRSLKPREDKAHNILPSGPKQDALQAGPYRADFRRDELGLEIERSLPGGLKSLWQRDKLGRPVRQEIHVSNLSQKSREYQWDPNARLRMIIDSQSGPTHYHYDIVGNLASAAYQDGRLDLRMPDAVGNLFKTQQRSDRRYGPAGQLLEATDARGTTRYDYDAEGNLIRKTGSDGSTWTYEWNGAGMLVKVLRPDRHIVEFGYDALARRMWKRFRGKTTRWVWDGNVPLHEWVDVTDHAAVEAAKAEATHEQKAASIAAARRRAVLVAQPAQGPPPPELYEGTAEAPITWLFEPESFSPLAKLAQDGHFCIITDYLGTPLAMYDDTGKEVWGAEMDVYGSLRDLRGERLACPFRWPGQYEDAETGLYYNRFRYYDAEAGRYISEDPIGLLGSLRPFAYIEDPLRSADPFGLTAEELADAMAEEHRAPKPGQTAHHIVKENAPGYADHSRGLLDRNGIGVNDSPNGAALWGTHPAQEATPGHPGKAAAEAAGTRHSGKHIHGAMNDKLIYRILRAAEKKGLNIEGVLREIGARMESGDWKKTAQGACHG